MRTDCILRLVAAIADPCTASGGDGRRDQAEGHADMSLTLPDQDRHPAGLRRTVRDADCPSPM